MSHYCDVFDKAENVVNEMITLRHNATMADSWRLQICQPKINDSKTSIRGVVTYPVFSLLNLLLVLYL